MSNEPEFKIALSKESVKYYNKVSLNTAAKLDKCFLVLETDPLSGANIKPLKGIPDTFRYRAGNLRVLYEVSLKERTVYILAIVPRGQAYKHSN
jgi:mRNA-degrading endonuclease RelE of RelBE toxin-antitoxin system